VDVAEGARLLSVSSRTAKRIAADHPELTAKIGRRRLFRRDALAEWIERGCPPPLRVR